MNTNQEVCNLYFNKERTTAINARKSLWFSQDDLYSYQEKIVIRFSKSSNRKSKGEEWYLLNGDKYSITTTRHQDLILCKAPKNCFTVSFTALNQAGDLLDHSKNLRLIDYTTDQYEQYRSLLSKERNPPPGFTKLGPINSSWHKPGYVLLQFYQSWYLCGIDEGSYFVSLLPSSCSTIDEALISLRPKLIQDVDREGKKKVYGQGEWFFVANTPNTLFPSVLADKNYVLPRRANRGNLHVASKGFTLRNKTFVQGSIFHRSARTGKRSGEHRQLQLEKCIWYEAIRNTSLGDWSSQGRAD